MHLLIQLRDREGFQKFLRVFSGRVALMITQAKKAKGDAVIKIRSVVILLDSKTEEHETPECSDDGAEGEILMRGIAIKWKPLPKPEDKKADQK